LKGDYPPGGRFFRVDPHRPGEQPAAPYVRRRSKRSTSRKRTRFFLRGLALAAVMAAVILFALFGEHCNTSPTEELLAELAR
jgi:type VI protein secretion system component VasF